MKGLIEDLCRESRHSHAMFLVERILPSELKCGVEDLFVVQVLAAIQHLPDDFCKDPVLDADAWDQNFPHACLLRNLVEHNSGRRYDVRTVRPKTELPNSVLNA